jgi:hypothetical protein
MRRSRIGTVEAGAPWNHLARRLLVLRRLPMEKHHDQIVESAVEARAGFLDRPVLKVLIASCVLAAVFLALTFVGVIKL